MAGIGGLTVPVCLALSGVPTSAVAATAIAAVVAAGAYIRPLFSSTSAFFYGIVGAFKGYSGGVYEVLEGVRGCSEVLWHGVRVVNFSTLWRFCMEFFTHQQLNKRNVFPQVELRSGRV